MKWECQYVSQDHNSYMTKIINLFGSPGTGKSSCAADLFAEMKWRGHNVELIDEYAKIKTWEKHLNILEDQLYVSAKQNRKLQRLVGQVDWVITDSPLIMCFPYIKPDYCPSFRRLIREMFDTYNNYNYFLQRVKPYNPVGRNQTEQQSNQLALQIKALLVDEQISHETLVANRETKYIILKDIGLI